MDSNSSHQAAASVWLFVIATSVLAFTINKSLKEKKKQSLLQHTVEPKAAKPALPRTLSFIAPHKDTLSDSVSMRGRPLEE